MEWACLKFHKIGRYKSESKSHYIKTTAKKQDEKKDYTPNEHLVNLLSMELHRIRETQAGRELPEVETRSTILTNTFFRLWLTFFEATTKYPELEDLYEDDIKDLLGIRR
jgi:hypothetical protein